MPTKEQVKQDILSMMRYGAPRQYRRIKREDPRWLEEWAEASASMAMAEIKAETYPGDNPDMIWSDLKPVLSREWLREIKGQKKEKVDPEVSASVADAMAMLRATPED